LPPTYYRGCWHVVSRGFLIGYRHSCPISWTCHSFPITEFYNPKTFIIHAALLGQGFPHCRKFPTAASRRSLGRVSVPVWQFRLSALLRIVDLVGRYLTNYLMRRKPSLKQSLTGPLNIRSYDPISYSVLATVSSSYPNHEGWLLTCYSPVRHSHIAMCVRLACIRHAASVYPEPGSNSPFVL
jgi:hypothetical protein